MKKTGAPTELVKTILLQESCLHTFIILESFIWRCRLNFRVSLVRFVGELLRVRVILADADEIDLQLERPVGFIRQSQSDGVDLEKTQEAVHYEGVQTRCVW